jgi:glycosyltransferase involved in cell wall biosynthesis
MAPPRTRVLLVVIDLAGGTGTFCRLLASGLKTTFPDEFALSALLLRDRELLPTDRELFRQIQVVGTEVHDDWRRIYETPLHTWMLRRAVRRSDADLVFTVGTYANLLAPAGARGRPVVLSVHAHSTTQLQRSRFGGLIGAIMRRRYRSYPIAVPTRGVAEDLAQNFHATRATVIPHGIEQQRVQRLAEEPIADLPTQRPYCIAVGRLTLQKNYPLLLSAFAEARKRGVSDDLLILGDGDQRPALEQRVAHLGLAGFVHLIGHRTNPFPYIKRARFLVLSSIWEGFGLSLLEAMALGVPVIACDCPSGPADILSRGEHGLLVPINDLPALTDAIVQLATDELLRANLSRKALARANELSLRSMAGAYRDLFTSVRAGR